MSCGCTVLVHTIISGTGYKSTWLPEIQETYEAAPKNTDIVIEEHSFSTANILPWGGIVHLQIHYFKASAQSRHHTYILDMILWRIITFTSTAALGLIGNLLAVIVLVKHPDVMGESQRLIINQSVIDALASVVLFFSRDNIEFGIGITIEYRDHW